MFCLYSYSQTIAKHWLHGNKLKDLDEISDDFEWVANASNKACAGMYASVTAQRRVALYWKKTIKGAFRSVVLTYGMWCQVSNSTR